MNKLINFLKDLLKSPRRRYEKAQEEHIRLLTEQLKANDEYTGRLITIINDKLTLIDKKLAKIERYVNELEK